jgi:hypothetical protein
MDSNILQVAATLYYTMCNTSLTLTPCDKQLFCQIRDLTGLGNTELVLKVVRIAAQSLNRKTVEKAVVQYQEPVGYVRLYLSVIPWEWHAVAALRNATGCSISRLLSIGLKMVQQNSDLLEKDFEEGCFQEYNIGTVNLFSYRTYKNKFSKDVTYVVPFSPMFRKKIPHRYR